MKRPLKHYAIAFYEALKEPGASTDAVIGNFVRVLHADGVLSKAEKIFALFRTHWNTMEHEVDVMTTSAHPLSSIQKKHIGEAVEKAVAAKKHVMHTTVDPLLLGGIVVRYNDTVLDGSVRKQLSHMKAALQA